MVDGEVKSSLYLFQTISVHDFFMTSRQFCLINRSVMNLSRRAICSLPFYKGKRLSSLQRGKLLFSLHKAIFEASSCHLSIPALELANSNVAALRYLCHFDLYFGHQSNRNYKSERYRPPGFWVRNCPQKPYFLYEKSLMM